jgi:hypothetical protein
MGGGLRKERKGGEGVWGGGGREKRERERAGGGDTG